MTLGTKTVDSRYLVPAPWQDCYNSGTRNLKIGMYASKSWSGSDTPRTVYPDQTLLDFSYPIYTRSGKFVRNRTRTVLHPRKSKLRKAALRENPFQCTISYRMDTLGAVSQYCAGTPNTGWRTIVGDTATRNQVFPKLPLGSEEILAIYGKLRHRLGAQFNAGVALGEARESLRMIAGTATRVYSAWKQAKRGRWKSAANTLVGANGKTRVFTDKRNFADNWLQLKYGWLPLLKDIESGTKHLAYVMHQKRTSTQRVRTKIEYSGRLKTDNRYFGSQETRLQVIAKISSVNELSLVGLTDPLSIAWELLPLSFVADWFIPIGATLDALALQGAITAAYVTTETVDNRTFGFREISPTYRSTYSLDLREVGVKRTIGTSLPQIRPPFPADLSKVPDVSRAITAVALVIQRMR